MGLVPKTPLLAVRIGTYDPERIPFLHRGHVRMDKSPVSAHASRILHGPDVHVPQTRMECMDIVPHVHTRRVPAGIAVPFRPFDNSLGHVPQPVHHQLRRSRRTARQTHASHNRRMRALHTHARHRSIFRKAEGKTPGIFQAENPAQRSHRLCPFPAILSQR